MRDDFNSKTKSLLSRRVGFRCSNPQCCQLTDGPAKGAVEALSIGEAAHICAAAPRGPRYDDSMTPEQRSSYDNGIWLCRSCAAMIDRDEEYYDVELLNQWKIAAEKRAETELHKGISKAELDQTEDILTEDEKIVLYYLLSKEQIAVSKNSFSQWCVEEEIYEVNYDNARLLLPVVEGKEDIQLDVARFRSLLKQKDYYLSLYKTSVDNHRRLSSYTIRELWEVLPDIEKLLIIYSAETNTRSLGDRWEANSEIESIKRWQQNSGLDDALSDGYIEALHSLAKREVLYPSDWTTYGNAKEYTFHKSAWNYINSGCLDPIKEYVISRHFGIVF